MSYYAGEYYKRKDYRMIAASIQYQSSNVIVHFALIVYTQSYVRAKELIDVFMSNRFPGKEYTLNMTDGVTSVYELRSYTHKPEVISENTIQNWKYN
jgi:hypothetical protein